MWLCDILYSPSAFLYRIEPQWPWCHCLLEHVVDPIHQHRQSHIIMPYKFCSNLAALCGGFGSVDPDRLAVERVAC